ncbi:30S ribosomal protein S17 [Spiribacter vilamensis]|uniref:Small ribosomal subunit protein uS17 n=1 Tax=Spiribacter vilamensis TaxID=531306 RepID=A0A4Q8CXV4_9GAMM|nr:30S ribosomal protein S17 [Spiribacter vilamensis]RZU97783.1 small subunit ribosomal protein S17 [Spiribacter vilamensis]TVO61290.1 30S ribosomal protein S17 [Spiribacter vilamensis]
MSKSESVKRTVNGRVVSTAMDKTITVVVERLVPHPLYGKYIRRTTKVHAHDEENVCQKGDWVSVVECRPVSKQKTWQLVDVLERPAQ